MPDKESNPLGVLLVNLGTPDAPTTSAIRRYLTEFLLDSRVVNIPRIVWIPILYGFILPFRPRSLVKKYLAIWGDDDSPIREHSLNLAARVQAALVSQQVGRQIVVKSAMTYGNPSISNVLGELREKGVTDLLVIPMFPQYSASTTAALFDKLSRVMRKTRVLPSLRFVTGYHNEPTYIHAITKSIEPFASRITPDTKVIFSFHGLPQALIAMGDPYAAQCQVTANLVAGNLVLEPSQWELTFQSRLGPAEWLKPYTIDAMSELPAQGIKHVILACPGFAVDCLETMEEIEILNRQVFLDAGGETFTYVPALNAEPPHVNVMRDLILDRMYRAEIGPG
ncbi:MAG: ferrochelatase [bacterium]|nr:ferrochelatase [Gammaproteobacteria bacterium]